MSTKSLHITYWFYGLFGWCLCIPNLGGKCNYFHFRVDCDIHDNPQQNYCHAN